MAEQLRGEELVCAILINDPGVPLVLLKAFQEWVATGVPPQEVLGLQGSVGGLNGARRNALTRVRDDELVNLAVNISEETGVHDFREIAAEIEARLFEGHYSTDALETFGHLSGRPLSSADSIKRRLRALVRDEPRHVDPEE